ncbi:MAG: hypothetical protein ACJ74X_03620 [Gaiellaceae bacterium]
MGTNQGTNERWRKLLVPGAASLLGAGAGLALTRADKLRDALPKLGDVGLGSLADDLRTRLSSTTGTNSSASSRPTIDSRELEEHRRSRAEHRKQRAGR